jgi:hypothetical protein
LDINNLSNKQSLQPTCVQDKNTQAWVFDASPKSTNLVAITEIAHLTLERHFETPIAMITEESALSILQLDRSATREDIVARYEALKFKYKKIKEEAGDLRTHLAYQLKQIELDDVYIYFSRKEKI